MASQELGTSQQVLPDNSDILLEQINGHTEDFHEQSPRSRTRTNKAEGLAKRLIQQAAELGANSIDLSNKGLRKVPLELLQLHNLEYLYLEGNNLSCLPDDFFNHLPNLKWLDLRRNYLVAIPSAYIGSHKNLRNMLLEHNELKSLPLELGLVMSLNGLNINNNPLEFPPPEVIEQGTKEILTYLRDLLFAKSYGKMPFPPDFQLDKLTIREEDERSSSTPSSGDGKKHKSAGIRRQSESSNYSDIGGPVPSSAELHKPKSYIEIKQQQIDKIKKAGAFGKLDKHELKKMQHRQRKLNKLPSAELIHQKAAEDKKILKLKEFNEKRDAMLQRRRDQATLRNWREESKNLQRKKYLESVKNGRKDFLDPVQQAPFGIDEDHIKVPTNEERIKQAVRDTHEKMRRIISPDSRKRMEEARLARDRELERRIKTHAFEMQERRKKPKENPQAEMEAAKRELAIVKSLQNDLLRRYQDLKNWATG